MRTFLLLRMILFHHVEGADSVRNADAAADASAVCPPTDASVHSPSVVAKVRVVHFVKGIEVLL
jgi:hypothetical protein